MTKAELLIKLEVKSNQKREAYELHAKGASINDIAHLYSVAWPTAKHWIEEGKKLQNLKIDVYTDTEPGEYDIPND